ncbi:MULTISPECIES: carotenoid biosynthesis protein [Roseobacteraceae]|uniref:carotenoid biosynthesis protein n=1 Tax=Roseobacteraceae TaxID=2854170 RepID=UPI002B269785|nr:MULTISPECIES: carotenoid biosynthesis protein [Roseobacteraceae]
MTRRTGLRRRTAWLLSLTILAWVGNALYATGAPGGLVKLLSPAVVASALLAYVVRHGVLRYGAPMMLRFVVTVFSVGWLFESLSVLTGFPFGRYHYTDLMAPFIGHVPIFVLPAYLVMGYASWSLATLLLDGRTVELTSKTASRAPFLAAFLMVLWDLSMDPLRATVEGRWVWIDGGPHHGVPMTNYAGWFLVTWVMFQCFALQLRRRTSPSMHGLSQDRAYWLSIPIAYAAFAGEYLLNPFTGYGQSQAAFGGSGEPAQEIFVAVAWIALCTLIPAMAFGLASAVRTEGKTRGGSVFVSDLRAQRKTNR